MNDQVSLRDIYDITGRIEDKLDKIEARVSLLEQWKATVIGQLAVVMASLSFIFTTAWQYITKKFNI